MIIEGALAGEFAALSTDLAVAKVATVADGDA